MGWVTKVSDAFTDTALTTLASHVPNQGGTWVKVNSGGPIFRITAAGTDAEATNAARYINNQALANDQRVSCVMGSTTLPVVWSIAARATVNGTNLDGYEWARSATGNLWRLRRLDAGVATVLDFEASSPAASAGQVLRIDCIGTTIKGYIDGVEICSATDATYASGVGGILASAVGGPYDNFLCEEFVADSTPRPVIVRQAVRRSNSY